MKKLIVASAICMMAALSFAAQCAGQTKAGERCKRQAAEGSEYCIGHADQAKKQKLKDDGTCWAVTEAGTRCKHKKDGESDYCKQHGPDTKAKTSGGQCRAMKWDGSRCTRKAEDGYIYCKQHRKQPATGSAAEKKADAPAKGKKKK